ncbi:MAG TPA: sugar phosphate isomerase/epimerase [Limnochordia bacterium]
MRVRIGNAPISWGVCEIPGWGPQLPYERVLDEHAAAGYEGTELGPWGYLPQDPAVLGEALKRRRLSMAAAFVPVDLRRGAAAAREAVEATARLLNALGAQHILLADAGDEARRAIAGRLEQTRASGFSADEWEAAAAGLHELARLCRDQYGLTLCFHPHAGTYVENPDEIDRLMAATDSALVRLCFDSGHIAFGGGDPVAFATRYAGRIGHVHLKDIRLDRLQAALERGEDYMTAARQDVFVELGRGSVDIAGVIDALKRADYSGWIIVEQDRVAHPGADTLSSARTSREFLRRCFNL